MNDEVYWNKWTWTSEWMVKYKISIEESNNSIKSIIN